MIELNQITTLFLAAALYLLGTALVNRIGILDRFLIPAPVVGGLLFAIVALILKSSGIVEVSLDTSLQSLFMVAFFTTVGLGASFKLIKLGGKLLIIYLLLCGVTVFMQNVIGVSLRMPEAKEESLKHEAHEAHEGSRRLEAVSRKLLFVCFVCFVFQAFQLQIPLVRDRHSYASFL